MGHRNTTLSRWLLLHGAESFRCDGPNSSAYNFRMADPLIKHRWRSWIPAIVFWTLFVVSIGLGERYPWLDTVWYAAWMLFLVVVAVYAVVHIIRHRHDSGGYVGYRGAPGWVGKFFGDDGNSK